MSENIQVVVRCRARNQQEIAAKSPIIVELPHEEHSPDEPCLTVTNGPHSIFSGSSRATASKKFTVDQVYGPNADQALLFKNVASPLFHDFISGLNVTILAYGQTGSGKTYSMFGDLTGENAGIIPRVLSKLFASIDTDHMVKISCVELYNEDLHDLINSSPSKPNLRLVSASGNSKQPTFIQNLKEVPIHSSEVGFNILKKCLDRRRTSATRLNDISSRSHTIFSIKLFRKKNPSSNDNEFIKSTMNLVDLAGSEDVNRSGAMNERAREAGSINQSLLTLGKVISTLSEGKESRHVPYRDSKLTRILQGSIGGHTKTALIATVSPAKVNVSETLSTLTYASKAKNIRNLPQSISDNDTMSKNVLVKDLSEQISRLEDDRRAAAEKDGHVKISLHNYKEYCHAKVEYETNSKEKCSQITKLASNLQEKSAEIMLLQQKLREAEAQVEKQIQELEFKDSKMLNDDKTYRKNIGELTSQVGELKSQVGDLTSQIEFKDSEMLKVQKELSMVHAKLVEQQTIGLEKQQEFATTATNLRRKVDGIIESSFSFVCSNALGLTETLDQRKLRVKDILESAQQQISQELNRFGVQFGAEWEKELTQQFDISQNIENIKALDVYPEMSQFHNLETLLGTRINKTLSLEAHYSALDSMAADIMQRQKMLKQEILGSIEGILDTTLEANQHELCNTIKGSMKNVISRSKSEFTEALESFSEGRLNITKEIVSKADEHANSLAQVKEDLRRKTDGAGARFCDETRSKINIGIQSLSHLNSRHNTNSVELVTHCFDEAKADINKSKDTFKSEIDATKGSIKWPLTETTKTNIPQPSPRRKPAASLLRSPQRYTAPEVKRRKLSTTTRESLENFPSHIPQLYPGRK